MFCERKHVLSFLKNPGTAPPQPSDVSQYYNTLADNYQNFFKNSDDVTFEQFTNIISLRQLEYWSGTSFAIRLFGETLIYANYGTYAWYGDITLKSKTNKDLIDKIYDKIGKLGFGTFMNIVISSRWKRDLINNNPQFCANRYHLKDDRLSYAIDAARNLQALTRSVQWIKPDTLKKIQNVFEILSPIVHSRGIVDPSIIDSSLKDVLDAYEEFYSKKNSWRIIYE
ncbi:MAG: hypothetical protein M0Z77_05405 [Thermoplasmatales archaeon]|nr:hypothetical protein [Thermoplasmatales archaeon]